MALAVIAILSAMATPAMREFLVRSNVSAATHDLVAALNLARTEAVMRGRDVAVIAAGDDWSEGWSVQAIASAQVLSTHAALGDGYRILGVASGSGAPTGRVVFGASGSLRLASAYDFSVCRPTADAQAAHSRRVEVTGSGSIRSQRDSGGSPAGTCS